MQIEATEDPSCAGGQACLGAPAVVGSEVEEPFFYVVAKYLPRVLHLSREEQLSIWRGTVALYERSGRPLPEVLCHLCEPPFVEALLEDEIFWGLAGVRMGRAFYAEATGHLAAVYAVAALLAGMRDGLPLPEEQRALIG